MMPPSSPSLLAAATPRPDRRGRHVHRPGLPLDLAGPAPRARAPRGDALPRPALVGPERAASSPARLPFSAAAAAPSRPRRIAVASTDVGDPPRPRHNAAGVLPGLSLPLDHGDWSVPARSLARPPSAVAADDAAPHARRRLRRRLRRSGAVGRRTDAPARLEGLYHGLDHRAGLATRHLLRPWPSLPRPPLRPPA